MQRSGVWSSWTRILASTPRWLAAALALFAFVADPAVAAPLEKRVALVIGNMAYGGALTTLTNPGADADRIARALDAAGFAGQVAVRKDQNRAEILNEVRALAAQLKEAGPNAVGFFYYSGHGGSAVVGDRRRNYLIPVKTQVAKADDLVIEGVPLDDVVAILSAAKARAVFIVFDACRNELPWSKGGDDADKAFGVVPSRPGLFIAFATDQGATAPDDGAFSQAIAAEIVKPGQSHLVAFDNAARAVASRRATDRLPWYSNQVYGDPVYFLANASAPPQVELGRAAPSTPAGPFRDCTNCPEMVVVRAGTFAMGSSNGEPRRGTSEGPLRDVEVKAFALARTETTEAEWAACAADGACRAIVRFGPKHPVSGIGLADAQAFIGWLNAKGKGKYRLPSEAEWEFAARAGSSMPFAFGPSIAPTQATYDWATSYNNSPTKTPGPKGPSPVGSYPPNAFGLVDMHGNVFEWVEDCFAPYDPSAKTAAPALSANCPQRIVRGGSWVNKAWNTRAAFREPKPPSWSDQTVGLRVARDYP